MFHDRREIARPMADRPRNTKKKKDTQHHFIFCSGRDGASTARAGSSRPSTAGGVTFVDGDEAGGQDARDDDGSTSTSVTQRDGVNHVLQVRVVA